MTAAPPQTSASLNWEGVPPDFPPRCRRCAYVLSGLQRGHCPECGLDFDLSDAGSFTRKPPPVAWKLWLPGFLLALLGGSGGAYALLGMGNWGYALWFAVPFAAGSLLGYRVRSGIVIALMLGLLVIPGLIVALISTSMAGMYCGFALAGIFLGPLTLGTILGAVLRVILKACRFSQRWHLPVWVFLALPIIAGVFEGRPTSSQPIEAIITTVTLPIDAERAFDALMFYEQVQHAPPFILRIGLAHPLYTHGSSQHVGDIKTCIYNKGRITKRITEVQPGRRLAFEIIEQSIGYEHDVRLTGGSFEFASQSDGSTRITLVTEYEPLLRPRWCWRPFERYAVHTLHEHVIEGMRRRAMGIDSSDDRDSTNDAEAALPIAALGDRRAP